MGFRDILKHAVLVMMPLMAVLDVFGQSSAPKYSNEFLTIGVGGRALGLSNAVVSNTSDVTSGYWNPSGLLNIREKYQFSFMHAAYFSGIANYDYIGFATPVDTSSHLAISVIRFGIDDIPDTRFLYDANGSIDYDAIRFFSAADYAFLLSYARRIPILGGLRLGASFKVIHRIVGDFANAWGFGLDIGAQKDIKRWSFGLVLRDVTSTFNAWAHNPGLVSDVYLQTGNIIPETSIEITLPRMVMGVGRSFDVFNEFGLNLAVDLEMTFDGKRNVWIKSDPVSVSPVMGLEFDYAKMAFLRIGAGQFQEIKDFRGEQSMTWQPNFGLGIRLKYFTIDYALTDVGDQAEALYSHIFSVMVRLNDKND